jgi:outer membrane lipoprotein carrier protein
MKHLLWLWLVVAPGAWASAQAEATLQRFVEGVSTLDAKFTQIQFDDNGDELSRSSGRVQLARPGRFRWSYEQPYVQLMVCDGQTIWLYDQDLNQVTVRAAAQALVGTPAAMLSDSGQLGAAFSLEDLGYRSQQRGVKLVPRQPDGDFKSIELWLAGDIPARMRFLDQLDGVSEIRFSEVRTNAALDPKIFRFVPPPGAEVIQAQE